MADLLRQGLEISVLGLGLTFAALGMLIGMMILLERLFRPKAMVKEELPQPLVTAAAGSSEEEEIAAAIGVAMVYWRAQLDQRGELGSRLEAGHGGWWRGARSTPKHRLAANNQGRKG